MRPAQAQGMERHLKPMYQQPTSAGMVMGFRSGQQLDVVGVGQQRVQIKGAPVRLRDTRQLLNFPDVPGMFSQQIQRQLDGQTPLERWF